MVQDPGGEAGLLRERGDGPLPFPPDDRVGGPQPQRVGGLQHLVKTVVADAQLLQPLIADFGGADRLVQSLAEGTADSQRLPDRLHLGAQLGVAVGELLQLKARHLHSTVVQGRFKARDGASGNLVDYLIQVVAHRQLGRTAGNRKSGGLTGQGR